MHDLPHDHDHDAHGLDVEEEHPLWKLDTITLTSVGIDVGTATSQIIFSQLVLRRLGRELSSRFVVTERDTLYLSPVYLTPYSAGRERVDDQALGRLVDAAYQEAGLTPRDITPARSSSPAKRSAATTHAPSPTCSRRSAATSSAPRRVTTSKLCWLRTARARSRTPLKSNAEC